VRADKRWEAQFDTSHHNRYLDNVMGVDKNGKSVPNGLNFWWDGQGIGNCWTSMPDTNIRTVPACNADKLPAIGTHRYFGEPAATLKMLECASFSRSDQYIPGGCDWYGQYAATGFKRVEVRDAAVGALVLAIIALAVFTRRLRSYPSALIGLLMSLAGLGIGVYGTIEMGSIWHPIGLFFYGIDFVLIGRCLWRDGTRKLGVLTYIVAALALLGAIDHSLIMIPYLPVSPALLRVLAEAVWVPWALGAVIIGKRSKAAEPAAQPEPEAAVA
jgi:hypothetical protein